MNLEEYIKIAEELVKDTKLDDYEEAWQAGFLFALQRIEFKLKSME